MAQTVGSSSGLSGGSSRIQNWVLGVLICLVVANSLFPYIWMLISSVKPDNIMYSTPTVWVFSPITDHYWDAFTEKGFGANFLNSIIVSVSTTLLVIVIGTPAAYSFARFRIWRSDDIFMYILSTRMAPAISLAIPFYLMFSNLRLLNTYTVIILAHLTFNIFAVVIFYPLKALPIGLARSWGIFAARSKMRATSSHDCQVVPSFTISTSRLVATSRTLPKTTSSPTNSTSWQR